MSAHGMDLTTQPSLFVLSELFHELYYNLMLSRHSLNSGRKSVDGKACEYMHLTPNSQYTSWHTFSTLSL